MSVRERASLDSKPVIALLWGMSVKKCVWASERAHDYYFERADVRAHAYVSCLHGRRGWWCAQGGTVARGTTCWANAEGNTSHRDVPVHEVCKSGDSGGGGTEIRREWNSQARARPPHLGREGGVRGLEGWRGRRGSEGEQRGESNKSRDTKTERNSEIIDEWMDARYGQV